MIGDTSVRRRIVDAHHRLSPPPASRYRIADEAASIYSIDAAVVESSASCDGSPRLAAVAGKKPACRCRQVVELGRIETFDYIRFRIEYIRISPSPLRCFVANF